jgi:hypothetical protein
MGTWPGNTKSYPDHPSPDSDLFRNRLDNMLDQRHELYRLADLIEWFETAPITRCFDL